MSNEGQSAIPQPPEPGERFYTATEFAAAVQAAEEATREECARLAIRLGGCGYCRNERVVAEIRSLNVHGALERRERLLVKAALSVCTLQMCSLGGLKPEDITYESVLAELEKGGRA